MKKIILIIIVVLVIFFFFVPIRKVVIGCQMELNDPVEIEFLTPFQAFKAGYLQIPTLNNNWTLKTEPNNICV